MNRRGYLSATSAEQLHKARWKDPPWLQWLAEHQVDPYILVTYDNNMPIEHEAILMACSTTLAILDKEHLVASGLTEEQYWRQVIHRHAHRFVDQKSGTIFKYNHGARRMEVKLGTQDP